MSERTLILLRHAKSDWTANEADIDRPLTERGIHQAEKAGRWLDHHIDDIDLAVVSPANRARSTWDLVSEQLTTAPTTRVEDGVYAASGGQLLGIVRDLPDDVDTVIMVCHNPGVEDLVSLLTGEGVMMPTSALVVIGVDGSWSTAGESPAIVHASGRPPV